MKIPGPPRIPGPPGLPGALKLPGLPGLPGLGAKTVNKLDILPPGIKEKKKENPKVPLKNMPINVVRPAEIVNSIWMEVNKSQVEIDKELLEREF